jgi:hypothetical protein
MSEPVIARRCPTCGATIREAALFCPQCGNGLPQRKSGQLKADGAAPARETISKNTVPLDGTDVESQPRSMANTVAIEKTETPTAPANPRVRGAVGAKIQRATTLARDVEDDVIHRVQKVREISSVVLDEAGYDPSLRFVLVAAGLFLLFLIIVVLNKIIS